MNKATRFAILATAIASLGGAAYAARSTENDALAINQAKGPIAQAIR